MNIRIQVLAAQARRAIAQVEGDLTRMSAAQAASSARTAGFGAALGGSLKKLGNFGNKLQWTGRQLQYNWTLPILAAAAAAAHFQMENEKAMTRVVKVYGDASMSSKVLQNETKALEGTFEALSERYGIVQAETIGIAAEWAAAGSSGIALAKATELTMKTMVLGQLEAADATQALIAIQAQYNQDTDELADTIARLNNVENQTGTTMGDLIISLSRSAGVARAAGVDVAHLAAMTAALVPAAGSAAQAGNALKTIISRLFAPTAEAADILNEMGFAINSSAWQSANATTRIELLSKRYESLSDSQKAVVSATLASRYQINKFEVLMDAIANKGNAAGDGMSYYWKALKAATNRTEYLAQVTKELNTVLDSNPKKWDRIKVIMQNTLANAIQPILPALLAFGGAVANLFRQINSLSPATQKWIGMVLLLMVILPLLIRYVGSLYTLFATIAQILWVLLKPFGLLIGLFGKFIKLLQIGSVVGWVFSTVGWAITTAWLGFTKALPFIMIGLEALGAGLVLAGSYLVAMLSIIPAFLPYLGSQISKFTGILVGGLSTALARVPGLIVTGLGYALAGLAVILQPLATGIVTAFTWLGSTLPPLMTAIGAAMSRAWYAALLAIEGLTIVWTRAMHAIQGGLGVALTAGVGAIGSGLVFVWNKIWLAVNYVMLFWAPKFVQIWTVIAGGITKVFAFMGQQLVKIYAAIGRALDLISWAIYGALTTAWFALSTALPAILSAAGTAMTTVFSALGRNLIILAKMISANIMLALASPWTWLVIAVAAALYALRDKIVSIASGIWNWLTNLFDDVVGRIIDAFNQLPQGVQNAFNAVISFIAAAAKQIAEWLSYLNPWARHSPSLVDNVNTGMAAVVQGYSKITAIKAPLDSATNSLNSFKTAAAQLSAAFQAIETAKDRQLLGEFAPGLLGMYDQVNSQLAVMRVRQNALAGAVKAQEAVVAAWKDRLDAANDALDHQKDILDDLQKVADGYRDRISDLNSEIDRLANTPIKGMGAMEDQLFANEMAQKRLRLEMLKAADQGGMSYDELRNKLALLSGDIETLTGKREELRSAGAGSEILSHYDDQINALEQQRKALEHAGAPVTHLQDQLDELQKKAEILDLEKALKFDPLTRAIDKAANSMAEMPFDSIISKIRQNQGVIDQLTPRYDAATAAVARQEAAVEKAQTAVDAIQASYDAESKRLENIRDLYQEVSDAISDMEGALSDATGAANGLKQAQEDAASASGHISPALQSFRDAEGGNFPDVGGKGLAGREQLGIEDQSGLIDDFTAQIAAQAGDAFGDFDMFGPIKDMWNSFFAWAKEWLTKIWNVIRDFFGNLFEGIDIMGPIRDSVGSFDWAGLFGGVWDVITNVISTIWDFAGIIWNLFGPDVINLFNTIWDFLKKMWEQFVGVFQDLGDRIQPFLEALGNLWSILAPIFGAIIAAFLFVGQVAVEIFMGVLGPVLDWISAAFGDLWTVIKGVIDIFIGLFTLDWGTFFSGLGEVLGGLGGLLWDTILGLGKVLWGAFTGLLKGIWDGLVWIGGMLWEGIEQGLRDLGLGWLVDIFGAIIGFVEDLFGIHSPSTVFAEIGQNIMAGLGQGLKIAWEIIKGIFTVIFTVIKFTFEAIGVVVNWLWDNIFKPVFTLIGNIIMWLWDNVIKPLMPVMAEAFKIFGDVVSWLWSNILKPVFGFIGDAFSVLGTVIGWVWTNILAPVFQVIGEVVIWLWNNILKPIFEAIGPAFQILGEIIAWVWNHILAPVFDVIGTVITWLWNNILKPIFKIIGETFKILGEIIAWVWEHVIKPAWDAIETAIKWLWNNILKPIFGFIGDAFGVMGDAIAWVWDNVVAPVWDAIETAIKWLWNNILKPVFDAISKAWEALGTAFQWVYDHIIKPIFDAFGAVLDTIKSSFQTAVDFISRVWNGLKNALMEPVQWVIDFVWNNGLRKLWNWISKLWDGDPIDPFVLASGGVIPGGGRTTQRTPGLAGGGVLSGYSPGRDIHQFYSPTGGRLDLSGGEAVLRPEFTRAVGSNWVDEANRAARQGGVNSVLDWLGGGGQFTSGWPMGDPASPQAAHRQSFAKGGLIGLPGWLSDVIEGGWLNFLPGGGITTAVLQELLDPINNSGGEGGGQWGEAIWGFVKKVAGQIWDLAESLFNSGTGPIAGGTFMDALDFAVKQVGKPYIWGGVGPEGYDCSGFMSALTNIILGRVPYSRVGSTASFPWPGFHSDVVGPFTIGSTKDSGSGIGHMAGTLNGINVESNGSDGVVMGDRARGAADSLFNTHAALFDEGGMWKSGYMGVNQSGRPERVLTPRQTTDFERLVNFLDREGVPSMERMESAIFRIEAKVSGAANIGQQTIIEHQGDNNVTINMNGDLVFPNINNGDDAKKFLQNLGDLAGRK